MMIVTGHSNKLDGICFIATTDDPAEALQLFRDKWNETFISQMRLVKHGDNDYLLFTDRESVVDAFEDDIPRHEGFILYTSQFEPGETILEQMPW